MSSPPVNDPAVPSEDPKNGKNESPSGDPENEKNEASSDDEGSKPEESEKRDDKSSGSIPVQPPVPVTGPAAILRQPPFIIKTIRYGGDDASNEVTGSILSQSLTAMLGGSAAGDMTLAALRKIVPRMSRYAKLERFCTPSGMTVDDESISIIDYLLLEYEEKVPAKAAASTPKASVASVEVFFRATDLKQSLVKARDDHKNVEAPKLDDPTVKPPDVPDTDTLKPIEGKDNLVDLNQFIASTGSSEAGAGALNESDWAMVLRNCGVFFGWVIDPRTNRILKAPKQAFQLRSKISDEATSKIPDFVSPQGGDGDTGGSSEPDSAAPAIAAVTPKSEGGIPNYRVNDDSHIEITAHKDDFTIAMAKSDFSEHSTEASTTAGGWGASVGVSVGIASRESNTAKTTSTTDSQTLVARYLFPRCDLVLWPDQLEPTPELAALIEAIRTSKSIILLRRLQSEYGQLFCQRVTLGGRLLSTKIVTMDGKQTLDEHKESFKRSVGVSVSGSFGGFSASSSVNKTDSSGSDKVNETTQQTQNETETFEAVGGDTILASNPPLWTSSVSDHRYWRIINREGLSTLAEMLTDMPGYAAVQSWFVQAVPALNHYISLDESHQCKVRLCVTSPTNALEVFNDGDVASFYLGHDATVAQTTVTPRLNCIRLDDVNYFWVRKQLQEDIAIFHPATYRAPVIFGYKNFMVGSTLYGARYDSEYTKTEWNIIAPFDTELRDGTRVILRSSPFPQEPSESKPPLVTSHMVVMRTAQGEFVPAMSDSDEYQYWRIIKMNGPTNSAIKLGDDVRLCWSFSDQTTGWRDFVNDSFGRREVERPDGIADTLFLKAPWPRMERQGMPTVLVMAAISSTTTVEKVMQVRDMVESEPKRYKYVLQDVQLRINDVANEGRGDAEDYMLREVRQEGTVLSIRPDGDGFQLRDSMFWLGV